MARILIITPKQPSSNPRMRKSADALSEAGHEVHVLFAYNADWADQADIPILASAKWTNEIIGGHPKTARFSYFLSRLGRKFFELSGNVERSTCRSLSQYVRRGINWTPDMVIGHNPGALAPITKIAARLNIPAVFDAEDYHRGESYWVRVEQEHKMIALEERYLPQLAAMTTAAPLISEAYRNLFPNINVHTVNNAFSTKAQPQRPTSVSGSLKVVWFSQLVGMDRGLQEFIFGMNLAPDIPLELNILGLTSSEKTQKLSNLIQSPQHHIAFHSPRSERALFSFLGSFEIGLALEIPLAYNREICRTNKLYSYPLAGCYMLASQTQSQQQFLAQYPAAGQIIDLNHPESIAAVLLNIYQNREKLLNNRIQSWQLAKDELNWETESATLVDVIHSKISENRKLNG